MQRVLDVVPVGENAAAFGLMAFACRDQRADALGHRRLQCADHRIALLHLVTVAVLVLHLVALHPGAQVMLIDRANILVAAFGVEFLGDRVRRTGVDHLQVGGFTVPWHAHQVVVPIALFVLADVTLTGAKHAGEFAARLHQRVRHTNM